LPFPAALYIKPANEKVPSWVAFLESATAGPITDVTNISTGALLFIAVGEDPQRIFAISFGYGHTMLKPDSFETSFGLKVALNSVNPDRLRSVDARAVEEMTLLTRRQASQLSPLETFGLDVSTDFLRAVTGIPDDRAFASRVTGADALAITRQTEVAGLQQMCQQLLETYSSERYRERFGWIDHLNEVRDGSLIDSLDDLLVEAVQAQDAQHMHLAPPEIIEWDNVGDFEYSHARNETFDDLRVGDLFDSLQGYGNVDLPALKGIQIRASYGEEADVYDRWQLYKCLVYETDFNGQRYVLSGGKWFQIAADFVGQVRNHVTSLPISGIGLPASHAGEREAPYNARAAATSNDYLLLDKKLVVHGGGASRIEFCDILTRQGQFVHVKRRSSSGTMSHLLAQGAVSAEAFLGDEQFRDKARSTIANEDASFEPVIPADRPAASNFEVVYAIIGCNDENPISLPFFTQLHLMQASRRLALLGFGTSVRLVRDD